MKNSLHFTRTTVRKGSVILLSGLLLAACMQYDESLAPRKSLNAVSLDEISTLGSEQSVMMKRTFTAHLAGAHEVPPNNSLAQGQAIFNLSEDGTEIHYKLIVANIQGVKAAHIHCGPVGENGPIVVGLFGMVTTGVSNGILAEGVITDEKVNDLACVGSNGSVAAVLELIRSGNAYVNVHTAQIGSGEIRGQIK